MSRYSLRPYVSVYRDPGSVQINTLQRQKFQQAFNADDALSGAVDQMKAADFEGDQALKLQLEQNTRQQLQDRSSRGDYETMMMDVAKSAREFDQEYRPIKQNAEMYEAYKKRVQDAYNEGDINALTYNKALAKSNFGYSGLRKNEDGSIDDGSFFSGYNFVKDVDIQALMSEAMKDFAEKAGGKIVQTVGQGPNAMYTIKVGNKTETVPPAQVAEVFNNLMARPDVAASVAQEVELRTFDTTDEQIRQNLTASLYGDENDPNNNGLIGLRDKAIEDGNNKLAAEIDEKIKEQQELLSGAGLETEAEQIEARKNYLRNDMLSNLTDRELKTAITKFAYENVFTEYIQDYDQKYLVGLRSALDKAVASVSLDTGVSQLNNPGGANFEDVNSYIETYQGAKLLVSNDATAYAREQGLIPEGRIITEQDILNGNVPKGMEGLLPMYRKKIQNADEEIYLQKKRLEQAYEETGYVQGVDNVKKNTYGDVTGQEFISNARDILNMPNASDEQVAARIADLGNFSKELQGGRGTSAALEAKIGDVRLAQQQINQLGGNLVAKFTSDMNPSLDKVNDYLEKNSLLEVGGTTSTTFPGETDPMAQENTRAIKQTFEKRALNPNFRIFYDGLKQDGTGSVASLLEHYKLDKDTDLKVTQVTFDMQPYLGEPTVTMFTNQKDPKTGEQIIVKVPTSNFQQIGMDQYFNEPTYQMAMITGKASIAGLDNVNVGFYLDNGKYNGHFQYNFDDKGGIKNIGSYDSNGKLANTYSPNDPRVNAIIRQVSNKNQSFRMMTN